MLRETQLETSSNELTKKRVKLVPRILRVAARKQPPSLSQLSKVETADSDHDVKYDRNKDKIYEGSEPSTPFPNA